MESTSPQPHDELMADAAARAANVLGRAVPEVTEEPIWNEEERIEAERAMADQLDKLGQQVPELAEYRESVEKGAASLMEEFKIKKEFFQNGDRSMIFFGFARTVDAAHAEAARPSASQAEVDRKRRFATSGTFLLTQDFSAAHSELIADHKRQERSNMNNESLKRILDKYEHSGLSKELARYIERNRIFESVEQKLQSPQEEPEPLQVHVLGVGDRHLAYFDPKAHGLEWNEYKQWAGGLSARTEAFIEEFPQGKMAAGSQGFAIEVNGEHHVYIPMAHAELLMAEEQGLVPDQEPQVERARAGVISTLQHERVHTMGGVAIGHDFGYALEERRAEWFSGDKSEYYDVKAFTTALGVLYGKGVGQVFDEVAAAQRAGVRVSVYQALANIYGLERMAEASTAMPDVYVANTKSRFARELLEAVGSFDEIILRAGADPRIDMDAATKGVIELVNLWRESRHGDPEYDEFLESLWGTLARAVGLRIRDIPYTPSAPTA